MADIRAQLNRVRDAANDAAATASDRIRDTGEKAREGASDLIHTGRERASDAYEDARDRTQRVATKANEIIQDHPVLAVAGAVAAGAVVAWMFPKSRRILKATPGFAAAVGSRLAEAAVTARAAAAEGAHSVKQNATEALHATSDAAGKVQDRVSSADISARATKLADDVTTLVSAKLDAISDAVRSRLPRN